MNDQLTIYEQPIEQVSTSPCDECGCVGAHFCIGRRQPFSRAISQNAQTVTESIESAYENASDEWKARAPEIVRELCRNRREIDLDCVAEALKPIDHLPHEPRAVGQLMRKMRKEKVCKLVRYEKSKRKSRHYGIISVDESLIFVSRS